MVIENALDFFVAAFDNLINFQITLMVALGIVSVDALDLRKYPLAKSFKRNCSQLTQKFPI